MTPSDLQKAKEAKETVAAFFDQFGELDEYKLVVLEVLFEGLYGKHVSVSGSEGQERGPNPECVPGELCPDQGNDSEASGAIDDLGSGAIENYPRP